MMKHTHLSFDERNTIAELLSQHRSFKAIAQVLDRDCSTIAKEIKRNFSTVRSGAMGKPFNNCSHRFSCSESWICSSCTYRKSVKRCHLCYKCNEICSKYEPVSCSRLNRPPYVCNGCPDKHIRCTLEKHVYVPKEAQNRYELTLRESRTGISLTEDEIRRLDRIFSPLLKKQQSIHHICVTHRDSVMVSESTIYRLVDSSLFEARNIDLPRKVRFAPRKKRREFKVDKTCRIGRTFTDYQKFMNDNPQLPVTQMDSVEGRKGGRVLLTLHFVKAECMLAFLRDANDSLSVTEIFNSLFRTLTPDIFRTIMPVLLGDNGSEFSNPKAIEFDGDGSRRTHVFYCDPSAPEQKGSCERNHEFIRMFIPKGEPLDNYSQADIDLMMSHINSYIRPSLGNKCPYEMMAFMYGEDMPGLLGLKRIAPDQVTLNADIWKKEEA